MFEVTNFHSNGYYCEQVTPASLILNVIQFLWISLSRFGTFEGKNKSNYTPGVCWSTGRASPSDKLSGFKASEAFAAAAAKVQPDLCIGRGLPSLKYYVPIVRRCSSNEQSLDPVTVAWDDKILPLPKPPTWSLRFFSINPRRHVNSSHASWYSSFVLQLSLYGRFGKNNEVINHLVWAIEVMLGFFFFPGTHPQEGFTEC